MRYSATLPVLILTTLSLSACSWVKLTDQGMKVRVLETQDVATCKQLGTTTATLRDKVAGIKRSATKVELELEMLARNSAVDLGGDTIVPLSEISEGKRTYSVYKCVGLIQNRE